MKYANWKQRFESDGVDSAIESSSSPAMASTAPAKDESGFEVTSQSVLQPNENSAEWTQRFDRLFGAPSTTTSPMLTQGGPAQPAQEPEPTTLVEQHSNILGFQSTSYDSRSGQHPLINTSGTPQTGMVPDKAVEKQVKAFVDIATPGDQFLAMMQSGTLSKVIRRRYGGPPAKAAMESVNDEDHTTQAAEEDSREAVAAIVDTEMESVVMPGSAEAESTAPDTGVEDSSSPAPVSDSTAPFGPGNFENFVITDTLPFRARHVYNALCTSFGEFNFELAGTEPNDQGHYFVSLTKLPPISQPTGTITSSRTTPFNFPQELKLQLNLSDDGTLPRGPGFEASMRQVLRGVMAQCCPLHGKRHDPRKCQTWVPIRRKEGEEEKNVAVEHVAASGAGENDEDAGQSSMVQPISYGAEDDPEATTQPAADDRDGAWTSYREVSLLDM